ncbi:MFS transporter [Pararobbsia silviterrae]|uniref:MFS transporter n=2 Tax=Pararobbsia silviterrae TaxID=1792498 RepID=A0A494XZV5_9BURK|nr:MFS transporter [Pararobbsia silviterrae]
MLRRVVIASVLGNAFEWFDFAIYGLFAVTIAHLYFPGGDAVASLMLTLATFGVGFFVRPLGGVLLGIYGDRVGRKKALSLTIALMALGTGMIGVLPTYAAIGMAAPILVVIARLIQGVSAGGEFSGATTMLIEFAPRDRRGFFGSFQMCSQALAFSLGSAVAFLLTRHLDAVQLQSWGWRLPFLAGILVGPVGWIIRSKIDESPEFLACMADAARADAHAAKAPLRDVLRQYPRELVASTAICVVGTVSAYVFVFFLPIFAKQTLGIAAADANFASFVGTAVILVMCPFAGYLSDRVGRKAVLVFGMLGYGAAAWYCFGRLVATPSAHTLLMLELGVSVFMSFIWGPMPIILTEVLPVSVRSTGAALTYNVAVMMFGGLAPFINTWLVKATGSPLAPLYYVMFSIFVGCVGAALLPGVREPRLAVSSSRG